MDGTARRPVASCSHAWKTIKKCICDASFIVRSNALRSTLVGSSEVFFEEDAEYGPVFNIYWDGMRVLYGPRDPELEVWEWIRGEWEGDFGVSLNTIWPVTNDIIPATLKHRLHSAFCEAAPLSGYAIAAYAEIMKYLGNSWDEPFAKILERKPDGDAFAETLMRAVPGPQMSMAIVLTLWLSNARPLDVKGAFTIAEENHGQEKLYNAHRALMRNSKGSWSDLKRFMRRATPEHQSVNLIKNAIVAVLPDIAALATYLPQVHVDTMIAEQIALALDAKGISLSPVRRSSKPARSAARRTGPQC